MLEYYKIYLPKSKKEVKLEVSIPRVTEGIIFDTIYFLDGQNAFKDSHASYGRSIRAQKALSIAAKELQKRIIGIAVYNGESEMSRINEYTPWIIDNPATEEWKKQNIEVCKKYAYDFIHTIVPFIDTKYKTHKDPSHRAIYGSSLGAIMACYLALSFKDVFHTIGSFSTPVFLFENTFLSYIKENITQDKRIFLYVGKEEQSDDIYSKDIYLDSSMKFHTLLSNLSIHHKLSIDIHGKHNEETWGNHILEFISYMYYENIEYK